MDPTEFTTVEPPIELRPFVRRYMYASRRMDEPAVIQPKPTGYTYFTYFIAPGDDWFEIDGRPARRESRWHLSGQIVGHRIVVTLSRIFDVLFCELTATGHHRLFGLPGDAFVGNTLPLEAVRPDCVDLAASCFDAGPDAPRETHVAEANRFFAALAGRAGPADDAVEQAVTLFERADGGVRVSTVAEAVGLGPRQLNRRFTHVVGVGPKFFGQILQINWVVGLLYANDVASLTRIAHDAGFYDQAHFNHAMRQFFSEGPREFLESDHLLFKTFLGQSRRFGPRSSGGGT